MNTDYLAQPYTAPKRRIGAPAVLAIIASALLLLRFFGLFVSYYYGEFRFVFPNFHSLLNHLFTAAPFILLAIYLVFLYPQNKGHVLLPIATCVFAVQYLYYLIKDFRYISLLLMLLYFFMFIGYTLATIFGFLRIHSKIFYIIAAICGYLSVLVSIYYILNNLRWLLYDGLYLHIVINIVSLITVICLYTALLIFALTGKFPQRVASKPNHFQPVQSSNIELQLRTLNDQFTMGLITEEEYHTRRMALLSQL